MKITLISSSLIQSNGLPGHFNCKERKNIYIYQFILSPCATLTSLNSLVAWQAGVSKGASSTLVCISLG